jgi:hypothetical protein
MKKVLLVMVAIIYAGLFMTALAYAGDVVASSAKSAQWEKWTPKNNTDVGDPAFKAISSLGNSLIYGFRGAVVFDGATKKAERLRMVTITRHKVEGFVNQINQNYALAAGVHEIAVYDFSKHKWVVLEKVAPDDSTNSLSKNFILTPQFVQVKQLNGPYWKYTTAAGWQRLP